MLNRLQQLGLSGSCVFLAIAGLFGAAPSFAAERLEIRSGPFARSVPVAALREYAETGKASAELVPLLGFVKSQNRESLQQGLKLKLPVDVVTVDRLVRSPAGEKLLSQASTAIVRPDGAGVQAVRGALILAAASKDGLGVLSFLEAYPSQTITVDLPKAMAVVKSTGGLEGLVGSFLKP